MRPVVPCPQEDLAEGLLKSRVRPSRYDVLEYSYRYASCSCTPSRPGIYTASWLESEALFRVRQALESSYVLHVHPVSSVLVVTYSLGMWGRRRQLGKFGRELILSAEFVMRHPFIFLQLPVLIQPSRSSKRFPVLLSCREASNPGFSNHLSKEAGRLKGIYNVLSYSEPPNLTH